MEHYSEIPFYTPFQENISIVLKSDEKDPNVVYIEASNENVDSQKDILFMKALEEEVENFLRKGVISWDHLHKIKEDPSYIIGEPLDVKFKKGENRTWVKGKLYKSVDYAKSVLNLIKSGCSRLGASVGGFIRKKKSLYKAISGIIKVIWDELAITYKPVNEGTLGNVSLIPMGAFAKALRVGGGVDAAVFSGGRALTKESLQGATVKRELLSVDNIMLNNIMEKFQEKLIRGDIRNSDELKSFLSKYDALFLYDRLAKRLVKKYA